MKNIIVILTFLLFHQHCYANNFVSTNSTSQLPLSDTFKPFPKVITLGQIQSSSKTKPSKIQQQVIDFLTPVYQRLGIKLQTSIYPAKRSLDFSNAGTIDGELLRVKNINELYPELIAVPITLYQVRANAYTINGNTNFKKASDILNFSIGINRGIAWEERFVNQSSNHVVTINGTKRKFKLLTLGRVHYVLSSEQRANETIKQHFPNDNIKKVSPRLPNVDLVHYLHKKHAHIIPRLIEEINKQQHLLPLAHN